VDALGLVGQLLDKMLLGDKPKLIEKPKRDRWDDEPNEALDWRLV
jgi:hypothetical protein